MVDCREFWPNHIWLRVLIEVAVIAGPGLIGLFVARKSPFYLLLGLFLLALLTADMAQYTFEVDGYHGCEGCGILMLLLLVGSWISLPLAFIVALLSRIWNRHR